MSERKVREFNRREKELLNAALELFSDEQWEKVTVAQIAEHAGIGKGTVYKHFSSKEEIYARLILDDDQETLAAFVEMLAGNDDPVAKLKRILQYSFEKFGDDSALSRVHFHCKQRSFRERLSDSVQQQFVDREQEFMDLIAPILERGMEEGCFMPRPLYQAFTGLEAIFNGTLLMIRNEDYLCSSIDQPGFSKDAFIAEMVSFMIGTLTGRVEPIT